MIHRALVRTGIELVYSAGFNPRPKISLPLPKTVGISSLDDLFCAQFLSDTEQKPDEADLKNKINQQLPTAFEVFDVNVYDGKVSFNPKTADYIFKSVVDDAVKTNAERINKELNSAKEIWIQRQIDAKGRIKKVEVGRYINSISFIGEDLTVNSEITSDGSIRPDEIPEVLGVKFSPQTQIIRTAVQWQKK